MRTTSIVKQVGPREGPPISTKRNYREHQTADKSTWGPGAWQDEPDKVQWIDEPTELDCLMVGNFGGAWCGYVGVPPGHPLSGVGYGEGSESLAAALERRKGQPIGDNAGLGVLLAAFSGHVTASPEIVFNVHGGLTFSDFCDEATEDEWLGLPEKAADVRLIAEAEKHPKGDAARHLASLRQQAGMTLQEWEEHRQARQICHLPEPGRPNRIWWFGFDCSHAGDSSPAIEVTLAELRGFTALREWGGTYRDRSYVEREVTRLAEQLAAVGAST